MTPKQRQTLALTGQMAKSINPIFAGLVLAVVLATLASTRTVHAQIDNHCSRTSSLARLACVHEVKEDYLIEAANCRNIVDSADRAECQVDAKDDRSDGLEECPEVFDARQDVCDLIGEARYEPEYDPEGFVDPSDIGGAVDVNPYFPLIPGSMWVYEAEDMAPVVDLVATPELGEDNPADCSGSCLQTLEWAPIEPGVIEYKYYQAGIGMVQEYDPESGETVFIINAPGPFTQGCFAG